MNLIVVSLIILVVIAMWFLKLGAFYHDVECHDAAFASYMTAMFCIGAFCYVGCSLPAFSQETNHIATSVSKMGDEYAVIADGRTYRTKQTKTVNAEDYALLVKVENLHLESTCLRTSHFCFRQRW